jgi:hypothetical protein
MLSASMTSTGSQRLGDPTRPVLVAVAEPVDAELLAVAEEPEELTGVGAPGDQHDLGDLGVDQCLDAPVDHGPVVDRQEVLVGDAGERVEPGAGAPGQDDALHGPQPRRVSRSSAERQVLGHGG